ncbi:MAG TPA: AAA family ATPase [Streptosporangiaceae bacterium]|nr:AAA family ATPase [Streptosporangiaceae bacterium]
MWTADRPPQWVGRGQELAVLRAGAEALGRGEGAVVWIEGEPGIGKSSLVAEALAAGGGAGWDIGWGIAGQLTERLPLRVMLDCLQVRPGSPDPRRAHVADVLRGLRPGLFADGDASAAGIERPVSEVGLGYLRLGEPTPSLSGGESLRLRIASRLRASQRGTLYVFDEPSTGLHPLDVATLVGVSGRLLRAGATIIVIDHDLDLLPAGVGPR